MTFLSGEQFMKPKKIKKFIYDEIKHLAIAKIYLKSGRNIKELCKRFGLTLKELSEVGKVNQSLGFIIQRIAAYSYIPEGEQVYHVEVPWISKFDPETHIKKLIDLSNEGKTTAQVCKALCIARTTYDTWRSNHKVFEDAHQYSKQCFQAYWEEIIQNGMRGEIEGFNATAISFFLRNQCKDDYADVKNIATSSTNTLAFLTDEALQKRIASKLYETKLLEILVPGNIIDAEVIKVNENECTTV